MTINRVPNKPYLGFDDTVYDDIAMNSVIALEERKQQLKDEQFMDSNLYTEILDAQYFKWKSKQNQLDLSARFKEECEQIPFLQQCKIYDC